MNITRKTIDELNGIIRINIEKDDYQAKVEDVLKDYRKKATMPGFRSGKVPAGLVKKMYGKAALVDEVNNLLTKELSKYLVDEKLNILGEPLPNEDQQKEIDWDNDENFEFIFDIGLAPEVKITLDKRSKYTQYKIKVTEAMIEDQMKAYQSRFGQNKDVDTVEETSTLRGNIVELDQNNEPKTDGLKADMALISIDVIKDEEIKKLFVGKKIDDEVIFDLKKAYPNDTEIAYLLNIEKENAAAVEGNFKVEIKEIHKFEPAEVNKELFKNVYGDDTEITTKKAFKEQIVEEIHESLKPSIDYKFSIDARKNLIEKTQVDFPVDFLKRWLKAANKDITDEQIEKEFDYFLEDLKWQIIKEDIIKSNELKVEHEEVVELAKDVAKAQFRQYGMFNVPDEHLDGFVQQMLTKKEDQERLYSKKMEDKIMDVIKEKVNVEESEISKDEFEKMFE